MSGISGKKSFELKDYVGMSHHGKEVQEDKKTECYSTPSLHLFFFYIAQAPSSARNNIKHDL